MILYIQSVICQSALGGSFDVIILRILYHVILCCCYSHVSVCVRVDGWIRVRFYWNLVSKLSFPHTYLSLWVYVYIYQLPYENSMRQFSSLNLLIFVNFNIFKMNFFKKNLLLSLLKITNILNCSCCWADICLWLLCCHFCMALCLSKTFLNNYLSCLLKQISFYLELIKNGFNYQSNKSFLMNVTNGKCSFELLFPRE